MSIVTNEGITALTATTTVTAVIINENITVITELNEQQTDGLLLFARPL